MDTAYYNKDLPAFVDALQGANLEEEFVPGRKTFRGEPFSSDYKIVGEGLFRGTPLVSLTAQSALGYDRAVDFLKALLQAGANPNGQSSRRGGLTPLAYLYALEARFPQFYNKFSYIESSLKETIKALLDAGAEYEYLLDENPRAFTSQIIRDALLDTRNTVFDNKRFVPVSDYSTQHAKFCADLSRDTNLTELRVLANEMGISSKGLRKADICDAIAKHIASIEAMSKDKSGYGYYREFDDVSE